MNNDGMYLANESGVYRTGALGQFDTITTNSSTDVVKNSSHHLFIGTRSGLEVKHPQRQTDTLLFPKLRTGALLPISSDSLLLVVQDRLTLLTQKEKQWHAVDLNLQVAVHPQYFYLPFIFLDSKGQIWLAGEHRLWCLSRDLKERSYYQIPDLLSYKVAEPPTVHCMLEDRNGVLWIGTNQGLLQLSPVRPFRHPLLKGEAAATQHQRNYST